MIQKIIFLCGSVEPGKDGVGDYTRRLATQLSNINIEVLIIAVADSSSSRSVTKEGTIAIARFSVSEPWKVKSIEIKSIINKYKPDVISWQMVPFAYNPYGVLRSLTPYFVEISNGFYTHLMLHELWIGDSEGSTLKEKILGFLGKKYLLQLIRKISPIRIHVTSDLAQYLLQKEHVASSKLAVFSNIDYLKCNSSIFFSKLEISSVSINASNRSDFWICVIFGTIHKEWNFNKAFQSLLKIVRANGKQLLMISVGRTSMDVWKQIIASFSHAITFATIGEKSQDDISCILQNCDFALSSYPDILVEKSGSIAAIRLHGIPVIMSRDELKVPGFHPPNNSQPLLIKMNNFDDALENLAEIKLQDVSMYSVLNVANQFIYDLEHADKLIN